LAEESALPGASVPSRAQVAQKRATSHIDATERRRAAARPDPSALGPCPPNTTAFVVGGAVTSWDPATRILWARQVCLLIPADVPAPTLTAGTIVTVSGYHWNGRAPWIVTEVHLTPSSS